ncbi:MAG: hypothetical protein M0P12_01135 [Paludibacteraceae bacterium]|nr:hypothetical protein [Paludibacteraceae bacterium]
MLNGGFVSYMDRGYSQVLTDNLTNLFLRIDTRFSTTNLTLFGTETVIIEGIPIVQTNIICKFIDDQTFEQAVSEINSSFSRHVSETNAHFVTSELIGAVSTTNSYQYVLPNVLYTNKIILSSNAVYCVSNMNHNVSFEIPETVEGKFSSFHLHLIKGSGTVTFFPNITWVYGEIPELDSQGTTYVLGFESLDGQNWRGWLEYSY